ncbi:phytanoyl-CoA dioxygenase family protein [Paenibacillus albus]|uniref:Phytanoyl-CoA dioxygenase family protein n=1 Tax=Paenibacillus albus TaxID=2495582 RepID=A0A3S9A1U2_9BACL|nr:phytanoyl-CoA dioxygenase family protein [Paenibacillus albus]AZN39642.1 phytanoyl-CoA dioxygenase family protein [Paenibacillus albus]
MSNSSSAAYTVTAEELKHYREQGFLIVHQLYTPEECDQIIARAEGMVDGTVPMYRGNALYMEPEAVLQGLVSDEKPNAEYLFKIGHEMHLSDPVFRYYAMHDKIADVLNAIIGPDIKCIQSMYIDKPRNLGIGQPYHQDSHYLKTVPDTVIGVWIACDDVDVANGCLHVIPGSQNSQIYPHDAPVDIMQRKYFQEVHAARTMREVPCILPKGSAVFFPGTLLHRSGNNVTEDRQRRAYVVHYADAQSKPGRAPAVPNPHLLVRGRQYPGCI